MNDLGLYVWAVTYLKETVIYVPKKVLNNYIRAVVELKEVKGLIDSKTKNVFPKTDLLHGAFQNFYRRRYNQNRLVLRDIGKTY